jgi:hypothetical protein
MRPLLAVASLVILIGFTACTSAYSVYVDARPKESASAVSQRLGARYPSIGFRPAAPDPGSAEFLLGRWQSGLAQIAHAEREGVLWIWITPSPGSDTAAAIVDEVKKIVREEAPGASIRVVESRSPDLR